MITAASFDITNGAVLLRLICALFFIPHMFFKAVGNPPPASKTFIAAGYPKPMLWMRIALVVEIFMSSLLFFDIYTQYTALLGVALLSVAAITVFFANDKQWIWIWRKGGKEYSVFWALCLVALSLLYWQ